MITIFSKFNSFILINCVINNFYGFFAYVYNVKKTCTARIKEIRKVQFTSERQEEITRHSEFTTNESTDKESTIKQKVLQ